MSDYEHCSREARNTHDSLTLIPHFAKVAKIPMTIDERKRAAEVVEAIIRGNKSRNRPTSASLEHKPAGPLDTIYEQDNSSRACCEEEIQRQGTRHNIWNAVKGSFTTIKHSSFALRLCERIYQSPHHRLGSMEARMLAEVLSQVLIDPVSRADHFWSILQCQVAAHADTRFPLQLQRVLQTGSLALQKVYSGYADREDELGPYIIPRSAPSYLLGTGFGKRSRYGATSWYVIAMTCNNPGKAKPLKCDIKIGITDEAVNMYWTGVLPIEEMYVTCMTPDLIVPREG